MVFPTTLYGWLIWFFSWFVVPLVMFWMFVIDGLRMLMWPATWVSNTRRGRKYWPRMQRSGMTIPRLRVLGFVFALGGTMMLVDFVSQSLRTAR
jgi:hypothetical protein